MAEAIFQQTIQGPAMCAGVGVHSGERVRLVLKPAAPGTGIRFVRTDLPEDTNVVSANGDSVSDVRQNTTLQNEHGVTVSTVEHLIAACSGLQIDNLIIEIDGPEVPIMDGSAALYCSLLLQTGLKMQGVKRRMIRILEPIEVTNGPKRAALLPSWNNTLELSAEIDFESELIGRQRAELTLTADAFVRDIAFARTFGFSKDLDLLQSMGLARGASLENTIALEGDRILNPEGLRSADEFVRHKILDAVGDLALIGMPVAGRYEAVQPGHAINNQLVRKLLETPDAWTYEVPESEAVSREVRAGLN